MPGTLTRRHFNQLSGLTAGAFVFPASSPDITLEIAPYTVEASPRHHFRTLAYNGQVPGALLRMPEGKARSVEIRNLSPDPEVVHWHGLFLPSDIDGAMEEGTPMIAPGASTRISFNPSPPGFRWFHTHTFAGRNLSKAQYGGLHGFLLIEPRDNPARYDREVFLGLHDWAASLQGSSDGSMNVAYEVSTVNGRMLGFGEPVRVKQGERVMIHLLNSSATDPHWIALAGHSFKVVALDGNPVPQPQTVEMLRLAPAERVSAIVEMNNPGVWVLGEVRKHIQAAGMGIVIEYAGASGTPVWTQPQALVWNYSRFASPAEKAGADATRIELSFAPKFQGHGSQEMWRINGKSYPNNPGQPLIQGQRYRLILKNQSMDDHPMHLHRHSFEVRRVDGSAELDGLRKDVVLVPSNTTAEIEFVADNPGKTLFHCHQQDHMDRGFMMVFPYA